MRIARATAVGVLLVSVLVLGGCKKKKPPVPPPQAQAPTITQPPQQPEAQPPAPVASEPNRPQPQEAQPEVSAPQAATTPAPKPKRKPHTAKKATPPPPEKPAEKSRTVVNEGGSQPATPQLSASIPQDTAVHQRFNTAQLLEATDYNLKSITRKLSSDEKAMVEHIRSYMQQSRDATKEGDTERAYNLALKAHLLSDELAKH
jgi:outer membrane biosynthesis protein TonB